jgi:hypothetical protein
MVRAAPPAHFPWLTSRSGYRPLSDARGLEAVRGERLLGMVLFDGWTATLAQAHVAVDTPLALRHLLPEAARYVFRQAERLAIVTMVDARNTPVRQLAAGVGFHEVYRIQDGMEPGVDMILIELRRENCRFLEVE